LRAKLQPLPSPPGRSPRADPAVISLVALAVDDPRSAPAWPGLSGLLDHLFQIGLSCMVLTPAPRPELEGWLERAACATRLPARICAGEAVADLPAPAGIHLAASRLAVPAEGVLLIADGRRGEEAGFAAGCTVVGLGGMVERTRVAALDEMVPLAGWLRRNYWFVRSEKPTVA